MNFIFQLLIDLLMLAGLLMIVAFAQSKRHFIISLAVINLIIFSLTMVIYGQDLSVGSGLGLFAMFSLMRYRSKPLAPIEMSFLLIAICFGVLNAVFPNIFSVFHVLILESLILGILFGMLKFMATKTIQLKIRYEKLELLKPEKHKLLIMDLEHRFNKPVEEVSIESISFPESYAILSVTLLLRKTINNTPWNQKIFALTPHGKVDDQMEPAIKQSSSSN